MTVAVLMVVAYRSVPAEEAAPLYLSLCAAALVVVCLRGRGLKQRLASWWGLLMGGLLLWLLADAVWFFVSGGLRPSGPQALPLDALYVIAYLLIAAALWALARGISGKKDRELAIDSLIIATAFGTIVSGYVLTPLSSGWVGGGVAALIPMVYPIVDVVLMGLVYRIFHSAGRRNACVALMMLAFGTLLIDDLAHAWAQHHSAHPAGALLDYPGLAFFILIALAISHPSATALTQAGSVPDVPPSQLSRGRLAALAAALLVWPMGRLIQILTGDTTPRGLATTLSTLVAILVVVRIGWLASDVSTAQKLAAVEEARFRRLADSAADVVFRYTVSPRPAFEYVSPSVSNMLGYEPSCFYEDPLFHRRLVPPGDEPDFDALVGRVTQGPTTVLGRWTHRDGRVRWLDVRTTPVADDTGTTVAVEGIARDITERIELEELLRQQIQWQQTATTFAAVALETRDRNAVLSEATATVQRTLNATAVELVDGLVSPAGDGEILVPVPGPGADGMFGTLVVRCPAVLGGSDYVVRFVEAVAHVTAQSLARLEAEDAREKPFRSLAENSPDLIIRFDQALKVSYANRPVRFASGAPTDDPVGLHVLDLPEPNALTRAVEALLQEVLRTGRPTAHEGAYGEMEGLGGRQGCVLHIRCVPEMTEGGATESVLVVIQDVTSSKRAKDKLERTVAALRRADELRRRVLAGLVHAETQERRRVAADIHDDAVQVMVATGMRLHALRRRVDHDASVTELLDKLTDAVETSVDRFRQIMFGLHPHQLEAGSLADALRTYAARTFPGEGPDLRIVDEVEHDPPPEVATIVYRIAQEALANAFKHARAGQVNVVIRSDHAGVSVEISDDGRGFVPRELPPAGVPGHLGLNTIRERAELAGGSLTIDSAPDQGTTVRTWIPVAMPELAEQAP